MMRKLIEPAALAALDTLASRAGEYEIEASKAISLKRIADALERQNALAETLALAMHNTGIDE